MKGALAVGIVAGLAVYYYLTSFTQAAFTAAHQMQDLYDHPTQLLESAQATPTPKSLTWHSPHPPQPTPQNEILNPL